MDSSTAAECAEIRKKLGGIKATAEATGSDTFERFTGPQIRKFYKTEPEAYAQTAQHRAGQFVHGVAARRENRAD